MAVGVSSVCSVLGANLTDLRVEGLVNPKGVEVQTPHFSWKYEAEEKDGRGFEQRSYRVLVGTDSVGLADKNTADVWDSGVRHGREMTAVYAGGTLYSRGQYYWKIIAEGNDGSRNVSKVARFEQGLLNEKDWQGAQWIGMRREMSPSIPRNAEKWSDYILSCDVCIEQVGANLVFRSLYATDMRYELQLEAGTPGVVKLFFNKWNERTLLAEYKIDKGIETGRFYPVQVNCSGSNIEITFDGKQLGNKAVADTRQLQGSVGVGAIMDNGDYGRALFDNFKVEKDGKILFYDDFGTDGINNFQDQLFWGGSESSVKDGSLLVTGLFSMIDDKRDIAAPLFRKEFVAGKKVVRARAYVASAGYVEMTVNGKKVTDAWLESGYSRYDKTLYYSVYDITPFLHKKNVLGFELGRGWYGMTTPTLWGEFRADAWMNEPKMKAVVYVEYADGSEDVIVTDDSFKMHEGPIVFDSLKAGEYFDSRKQEKGWNTVAYDASDWKQALVCDSPQKEGVRLLSQMFEPIRAVEKIKPVSVTRLAEDVFWIDFGRHMSGTVSLETQGKAGDVVRLQYAERMEENGQPSMWRFAPASTGCYQQDIFILGGGKETLCAKFSYKGFRYVMVYGMKEIPNKDMFTALVVNSDMERTGSFYSSSDLWNRISDASLRSIQSNMHSIPTDCPTFEKLGWACDDAAPMEAMMYYFNISNLYKKRLLDYSDDIDENGVISDVLPSTWGLKDSDPAWNGSYIAVAWKYYQYYGDKSELEKHYDNLKAYIGNLQRNAVGNILTINENKGYGDWCPPDHKGGRGPEGLSLYHTVYYYWYTSLVQQIADILGKADDSEYYRQLAENIKASFNERYFDYDECAYYFPGKLGGYRQASQVLPLYFKMEPEGYGQRIADKLAEDIRKHDNHLWVGILGFEFIADVLMDYGYTDLAYAIHLQDDFPSVGNMIREGATTLWESYSLATTRSLNHKMYAPISEWFFRRVAGLGVNEKEPGFQSVVFSPTPCAEQMDYAGCEYNSVCGQYKAGWKNVDGGMEYSLTLPPNTDAWVVLPLNGGKTVKEADRVLVKNGKLVVHENWISDFEADKKYVRFKVKSGNYKLVVK